MRIYAAMLLSSMLVCGGCVWSGPALYDQSVAETPIPAGRYRITVDGDPATGTVSASGTATMIRIDGKELLAANALLIPLADGRHRLWVIQTPMGPDRRRFAYGLIERTTTGWTAVPFLACAGSEAMVRKAGGLIERKPPPGTDDGRAEPPACVFRTRSALETALRDWFATRGWRDAHGMRLTLEPLR